MDFSFQLSRFFPYQGVYSPASISNKLEIGSIILKTNGPFSSSCYVIFRIGDLDKAVNAWPYAMFQPILAQLSSWMRMRYTFTYARAKAIETTFVMETSPR